LDGISGGRVIPVRRAIAAAADHALLRDVIERYLAAVVPLAVGTLRVDEEPGALAEPVLPAAELGEQGRPERGDVGGLERPPERAAHELLHQRIGFGSSRAEKREGRELRVGAPGRGVVALSVLDGDEELGAARLEESTRPL